MGLSTAATGVLFRTGSFAASSENVASGLVLRFGSLDCITDNATFPQGSSIIHFSDHHVYVVVVSEEYPSEVLTFSDPPPIGGDTYDCSIDPCTYAEVMMAGSGDHSCRPPLERTTYGAGTSSQVPVAGILEIVVQNLGTPIDLSVDPATAASELEATRQCILEEALEVAAAKRQLETTLREYNSAHGLTPANDQPSRRGEVRRRGGDLGKALARDDQPASWLAVVQPTYSSPVKNVVTPRPTTG
jgi:hypothetical protein